MAMPGEKIDWNVKEAVVRHPYKFSRIVLLGYLLSSIERPGRLSPFPGTKTHLHTFVARGTSEYLGSLWLLAPRMFRATRGSNQRHLFEYTVDVNSPQNILPPLCTELVAVILRMKLVGSLHLRQSDILSTGKDTSVTFANASSVNSFTLWFNASRESRG